MSQDRRTLHTQKTMGVNSKAKGSTFERKISNLLSKRFAKVTGLESAFRRNPSSGAFFGGLNQCRITTHNTEGAAFGDIMCPSNFKYSIECKHYKSAPTFSLIINQSWRELDGWISQAAQDAKNGDKLMAIIVKYNNVPEIVVLDAVPTGMKSLINYKHYYITPLTDWLEQADSVFF